MKKISDILFKNLIWKIVSLAFAVVLWLVGININDPVETTTFTTRLSLENKDRITSNGFVISNQDTLDATNIRVTVSATRSRLNAIRANNVKAYIDLKPIDYTYEDKLGENQALTVYTQLVGNFDPNYYQLTAAPYTVNLVLDKLMTVEKQVMVDRKGDPDSGFIAMQQQLEPETVSITGARLSISQIDSIRVEVDLKGATEDIVTSVQPRIYNSGNKDITGLFTLDPEVISLVVPVNMYAKIPVYPSFIGEVAEGCVVTSVTQNIQFVEVVGSKEDIGSIKAINLTVENLEGLSDSKIFTYDLRNYLMSSNLSIRNGTPHEANVTVNIEKEVERLISIPVENLNIVGVSPANDVSMSYDIEFSVKGIAEKINSLLPEDISGVMNLSGCGIGIHEVEVSLSMPTGITLEGNSPIVEVVITDRNDMPEDDDKPENEIDIDLEET